MNAKTSDKFLSSCSDNRKSKIENLKWVGLVALVIVFVDWRAGPRRSSRRKSLG